MPYASHPLHFSDDRLPAAVDGWFNAMAALYQSAPRDAEADARYPLFVSLGSQGILDAVLHPLDPGCGRHGFAFLTGSDDYEAWLALEATGDATQNSPCFHRLELTFGPLAEAHPDVRSELEQRERDLGDLVPSAWSFDDSGTSRPVTVDDLILSEAIAAAVAKALEASPENVDSLKAGNAGEPMTYTVETGGGDMDVELSTRPIAVEAGLPAGSLLDALSALNDEDGWLAESQQRHTLEYRLGRRFLRSPEAAELTGATWYWQTLAQWGASHIGLTIASLDADSVDEVVFETVPRKHSADVDFARPFIECLRAFYRWLEREYALPQAPACLALLNAPDAVERLEALMGDSANVDPAKAMVMQAKAMGIDPTTPEGMMQMRELHNSRLSGARSPYTSFDPFDDAPRSAPPLDPDVKRKRDAKRKAGQKAARKARKKNRK